MRSSFQNRWLSRPFIQALAKPYVHILFGARQTGKTALLHHSLPHAALWIDFANPEERNRHLMDPGLLRRECLALPQDGPPATVVMYEAQTVPTAFDAVQSLFDSDKTRWRFILCGSSGSMAQTCFLGARSSTICIRLCFPSVQAKKARLQCCCQSRRTTHPPVKSNSPPQA